jgi:hypothetical protein
MAMVPLEECKIPTLMPSPAGAALAEAEAVAELEGLSTVTVVVGVQDLLHWNPKLIFHAAETF